MNNLALYQIGQINLNLSKQAQIQKGLDALKEDKE